MLKFFGGIIIVCITTCCGILFARKYKKRKEFFAQFEEFNARFLTEISYFKRPLAEFIYEFRGHGEYGELIEKMVKNKNRGLEEGIAIDLETIPFLNKEEKGFLLEYFLTLGKGNSASQKAYYLGKGEEIARQRKKTEEDAKKYGDLYWKLGFLLGLAILILIV